MVLPTLKRAEKSNIALRILQRTLFFIIFAACGCKSAVTDGAGARLRLMIKRLALSCYLKSPKFILRDNVCKTLMLVVCPFPGKGRPIYGKAWEWTVYLRGRLAMPK